PPLTCRFPYPTLFRSSANAMRAVGSSQADPYCSTAAAAAALYGPLHGGANEQVLRMLNQIGSKDAVPDYVKRVKAGEMKLMGFGDRKSTRLNSSHVKI